MYLAKYDFGDFEISQISAELCSTVSDKAAEGESIKLLLGWLESNLAQQPESGVSLSIHCIKGELKRYLRLYTSADNSVVETLAKALNRHQLVARLIDQRDEFDQIFNDEKCHLAMIQNSTYQANGVDMVTDYLFTDSFEEVARNLTMSGLNFNYQINFNLLSSAQESLRFVKKSVIRLEEMPGVPAKLIKQQQRFVKRAEKSAWVAEEFISCDKAEDYRIIKDLLLECFADEHEKYGFPALLLQNNEAVEEQYYLGLHSRIFESITPVDEASQLMSNKNINALLVSKLPVIEPKVNLSNADARPLPQAISSNGLWDVFLSHSSKDQQATKAVCHYLEAQGIRCWMAPRDIRAGELWSQEIMTGIKQSKVCVLLLSSSANESRYVLREIEQSVNLGHAILPLRIEDIRPSDSLSFFVSSHHWFDAANGTLEQHLPDLAKTILPHL